jgi:hypothetical protein
MTSPFLSYAFKASPISASQVARTLPMHLSDFRVSVKDFGARGNNVNDDTAAINAAIDYIYTLNSPSGVQGRVLFFPPGSYRVTGQLFLDRDYHTLGFMAGITVVGSGRDVTTIIGNYWTGNQTPDVNNGFLVKICRWGEQVVGIRDLTIYNESVLSTSGALELESITSAKFEIRNCHFKAVVGLVACQSQFGISITDCLFTCSRPITSADAATPSPLYKASNYVSGQGSSGSPPFTPEQFNGSTGIFFSQGRLINCHARGFDVGFAAAHVPTVMIGCSASRCDIGFWPGLIEGSYGFELSGQFPGIGIQGTTGDGGVGLFVSNLFDRCTYGTRGNLGLAFFGANRITGTTGPLTPATIQNITWSGGTATVTTSNNHNLAGGFSDELVLVTDPPGWTPDGTGAQRVSCTRTGTNTFTYALGSSPGSFNSGSWNYPLDTGITCQNWSHMILAANMIDADTKGSGVDMNGPNGGSGPPPGARFLHGISFLAMRCPRGWAKSGMFVSDGTITTPIRWGSSPNIPANYVLTKWAAASYEFIQCGDSGSNHPIGITFQCLPGQSDVVAAGPEEWGPIEGQEFTVFDCATQNTFGGTVTGGGSNHYKVRYNGTNWTRIG